MSPIIGHTSGTSSNTVCTEEDDGYEDDYGCGVSVTCASVNDYGHGASTDYVSVTDLRISHTKKEYDYEDNDEDFYKFYKFNKELNEDSVHPDGKYCSEACCELQIATWWKKRAWRRKRAQEFAEEQGRLALTGLP